MHVAAIQFPHPEVTIRSDTDSNSAAAERNKVFAEAATQGYLIGAAHVSYPGLGYLRAGSQGYRGVPLNYSPLTNPAVPQAARPAKARTTVATANHSATW